VSLKAVIQAARYHRRKFMEQASTDQSERLAWDLLLAEYLPVLLDVTQLCELNVLKRETAFRRADCVHVDAGSFYFRGLQQDSEINELAIPAAVDRNPGERVDPDLGATRCLR
jgi:hypothetical protein